MSLLPPCDRCSQGTRMGDTRLGTVKLTDAESKHQKKIFTCGPCAEYLLTNTYCWRLAT
jgi:hypothetical protein